MYLSSLTQDGAGSLDALHDGASILLGTKSDLLQVQVLVLPLHFGLRDGLSLDTLHVGLKDMKKLQSFLFRGKI